MAVFDSEAELAAAFQHPRAALLRRAAYTHAYAEAPHGTWLRMTLVFQRWWVAHVGEPLRCTEPTSKADVGP